jgi:tetratricopeptide (TPR) repeat protein
MPPEQFRHGSNIDQRSDIYSFGIVLYEIITGGQLPFKLGKVPDGHLFEYFHKLHLTYELPKLNNPLFPIIERCLKKLPDDRYSSFGEIRSELEKLYLKANGKPYIIKSKEEMSASDHINFAVSYQLLGDLKKAIQHIDAALKDIPGFPIALNNKASFLMMAGKANEAIEIWGGLTKSNPELGRPYYNLGNLLLQQKQFKDAISYYGKAVQIEPDYVPALINQAIAYQELRDAPNALKLYEQAIGFNPGDAQIHYNYAFLCYQVNELTLAEESFRTVLKLNPRHLSAYNYLGLCYLNKDKPEIAIEVFQKALAIDPTYKYAIDNKNIAAKKLSDKKGFFGKLFGS